MRVLRFLKSVFKDIFLNIFHISLALITFSILFIISALTLYLGVKVMSIMPVMIARQGYNKIALLVLMSEIVIALLFIGGINIFKLPIKMFEYLKRKWNETN